MPTSNHWLVENQVILSQPNGVVTLDEFAASNIELVEMLRAGFTQTQRPVHLVVDASRVVSQPSPLETRKIFTYMQEPALGWTVIGGMGNPILSFFSKMVSSMVVTKTRIFESPAHALQFLQRHDPTLPDLLTRYVEQVNLGNNSKISAP